MESLEKLLLEDLMELRKMPHIYLGKKSLRDLESYIRGANIMYDKIVEEHNSFLRDFEYFVRREVGGGGANSAYGMISNNASSDEEAFDTYFELLDEYLTLSEDERKNLFSQWLKENFPSSEESAD